MTGRTGEGAGCEGRQQALGWTVGRWRGTGQWTGDVRVGGWVGGLNHARSPRMRRASCMSLGMMVTRLAWMAHRLVSSNRPTR